MRLFYFILIVMPLNNLMSQDVLQTKFYKVIFPKSLTYEKLNSAEEDYSITNVYKVIDSEKQKVKYLVYLMSNKSNLDRILESNLEKYLKDFGNVKILDKEKLVFENKNVYRLKISLKNNITGILYLMNVKEILYRMMFMTPEKHYLDNEKEITNLFTSTSFLKTDW